VTDTEKIKWELWSVAYGVWDYIKNSGNFPEAETLTLEWMGMFPGKRESRRFLGDVILTQQDIVEQTKFDDAVSFGGWAIDLHPADGVFSTEPSCTQWHSKGVYQIPYRAMYSRTVSNLFLAGRLLSASHIAFGSTRVMATCAHNAQAVGMAAVMCIELGLGPRDLVQHDRMEVLQQRLLSRGQHIPGLRKFGLAEGTGVSASSTLALDCLTPSGELHSSDVPCALLFPAGPGLLPQTTLRASIQKRTTIRAELWASSREGNTTPDHFLEALEVEVEPGDDVAVVIRFNIPLEATQHVFLVVPPFPNGALFLSREQRPGVLMLTQKMNAAVAKSVVQTPPPDTGIDSFAFWLPTRRPEARTLAATFEPALRLYEPCLVLNGFSRPWCGANAWAPAPNDREPWLAFKWAQTRPLCQITITFDTDYDHPMESVLLEHPERVMPGCVTSFRVETAEGVILADVREHHQSRFSVRFDTPVSTSGITLRILAHGAAPPSIFQVECS
jgi:hypothetical protein